MAPFPQWMFGCPGRVGGLGWDQALEPSLTGLHKYDRVSRKKADEGVTKCTVCGGAPASGHRADAWRRVLAAEELAKEESRKRSLFRAPVARRR